MAVKREQVVQTAEKYVARGKIEPAIREYRKLLEENPNDINTLNRVGDLYARIQRIDEAVDFFNQIAEQYAGEGFFVKAIAIYKKIIKLDPTRLDVYENLAELYHRQGLVTEARTQYQVLADYYQKHENATSTIAIYQKMADLEPNNPTYHVKLAELYQGQKLVEKAMGEYRVIAELMIEHGHPQEAAQVYERALAIDSTQIGFITDAALKLKEAAGAATAARFLAAAVERNPQAAQVARLIGSPGSPGGTLAGTAAADLAAARPLQPPPFPAPAPAVPAEHQPAEDYYAVEGFGAADRQELSAVGERAYADTDLDMEIELDLGADLVLDDLAPGGSPGGMRQALTGFGGSGAYSDGGAALESAFEVEEDEPPAPGGPARGRDLPGGPARDRHLDGGPAKDRHLDNVEDVFVLDIEDEEEPASLVKPPPDMLRQPSRPSWAQDGTPAAGIRPAPPPPAGPRPLAPPPQPPLSGISVLGPPPPPAAAADGEPPLDEEALGELPELPELPRLTGEFALINPFSLLTEPSPPAGASPPAAPAAAPAPATPPPGWPPPPDAPAPAAEPGAAAGPQALAAPGDWPAAAGAAEPPLLHIDSELLERTAAEIQPQAIERYEDLVSEAEVLAKYGLEEKAIERLRDAIRIKPRQLSAYFLLIQLQLDKGRNGRVMELANQVAQLTAESADRDTWPKLRRRLLAAGFRVDGERVIAVPDSADRDAGMRPARPRTAPPAAAPQPDPAAAAVPPPGAPEPPPPAESGAAPGALVEPQPAMISPPAAAPGAAPTPHRRSPMAGAGGIDQMLQGLIERPPKGARGEPRGAPSMPAPSREAPAAPPPGAPAALSPAVPDSPPPPPSSPAGEPPAAGADPAVAAAAASPAAAGGDSALPAIASGDDFYELPPLLEAGAEEVVPVEAPPLIFNPLEIGAMVESEEIDWDDDASLPGFGTGRAPLQAPQAPQPAQAPPAAAAAAAREAAARQPDPALDDTGMSWLDEADSGKDDNAARAASLFEEEEDFFDLAGELEQELSQEEAFQASDVVVQQEQSLEEIVEGFKKGVAEHLSPTDYDTHYNLGIAYREMGLLDEAIGEFQLSAKDPRYLVSCCSMLGLCFLDKGLPELAIKWYRRGLEAEEISEEDTLGLLYDMGCAHLAMGDDAGAYKTFVDVYGINTNYRDVVARIEELGHPHPH
jgi:tetratricopeptide (TPR) repeat protein